MARIVLATHNKGKIREFQAALSAAGYEGVAIGDICQVEEPEETGTTFRMNALLKAAYYMKACGLPCMADDSGLEVDALNGEPGVYSARYAGEHATDEENNQKLLRRLAAVPQDKRHGRYVCALALVWPDGKQLTAEGFSEGEIHDTPEGDGGFGYDPYFYVPSAGQTMAAMPLEEKNKISHRGLALKKLMEKLQEADKGED